MSKPFWKSKTFWLQALHVAVQLQPFVPINHTATAVIMAVVTAANRFVTDGAVTLTN